MTHWEAYNKDVETSWESLERNKTIESSKSQMIDQDSETDLLPSELRLLDRFAIADALAKQFRDKRSAEVDIFKWWGFAAATLFACSAHLFHSLPIVCFYLLILGYLFLRQKLMVDAQIEQKSLDYRALAEGLRVQLAWKFVNLDEHAADHYLRKQRSEVDWIRHSLRTASLLSQKREDLPRYKIAKDFWLVGQRKYFTDNAEKLDQSAKNQHRWHVRMIWAAVSAASLLLAGYLFTIVSKQPTPLIRWFYDSPRDSPYSWVFEVLTTLIATCIIYLASCEWKNKITADAETAKQYRSMKDLYILATERVKRALELPDPEKAKVTAHKLFHEVGREALSENGDWVLLHRDRTIETPVT
jgi:hypothetical protein